MTVTKCENQEEIVFATYTAVPHQGFFGVDENQKIVVGMTLQASIEGFDILGEEITNIGSDAHIILPGNGIELGKRYSVTVVNETRDWETGHVEDYDLKLTEVPG